MKRSMRLSALGLALCSISFLTFSTSSFAMQPTLSSAYDNGYEEGYDDAMDDCADFCPSRAGINGWYAGLGAGYEGYQAVQKPWFFDERLGTYNTHANGWTGHLFGGYGYNFRNRIYLGAEAFVGTSGAAGSNSTLPIDYRGTFSVNNSYGASIIPGYRCPETGALYYGRVGVTQTQFTVKDMLAGFSQNSTTWHTGLNLGLGVELPVYNQFSVRFEYDYFDYSSFNNNSASVGSRNEPSDNRGTIDLKYNFGNF